MNRTDNVEKYTQLYQTLADEYHRVFYNPRVGAYVDRTQPMNILSLALPNVVPPSLRANVLDTLVKNLQTTGYFTGGIVSVAALYPLLSKEGYHDLALKLAQATSYPSYGYMFNNDIQNATTIWEQWNALPQGALSSLNHHMFNSIGAWFYRYVAGIELNGLRTITIHPRMPYEVHRLTHVRAEVVTIKGPVKVEWSRESQTVMTLTTSIPNNLDAIISFDRLVEKGQCIKLLCDNEIIWMRNEKDNDLKILENIHGISDLTENVFTGTISVRAASGQYTFVAYWQ